jgi:hypothetical protein
VSKLLGDFVPQSATDFHVCSPIFLTGSYFAIQSIGILTHPNTLLRLSGDYTVNLCETFECGGEMHSHLHLCLYCLPDSGRNAR